MCPLRMFIARNVGLYLVGGGDPYWNVRSASFVLGQGPRWRWQQGVNCQSFLRVNILWQRTGSTVNPVLGVNILSFTAEGESIYVRDMFCLLTGCGNAWGQNTSDTTPILHLAKVIYFEDRRGERNWNRSSESIIRKSKKSGITDFLSMNSPCGQGSCPLGAVCCCARRQSEDALWLHCVAPTAICGTVVCPSCVAPVAAEWPGRPRRKDAPTWHHTRHM